MTICPNCQTQNDDDAKFCTNCGTALEDTPTSNTGASASGQPPTPQPTATGPTPRGPLADDGLPVGVDLDGEPGGERLLWQGRPGWPLSWVNRILTRYKLTNERLIIEHGFIRRRVEQIIGIETTDATAPEIGLKDVKDPNRVKDLVWQAARIERQRRRVLLREDV
jgi:zinc ribbon protein